MTLGQTWPQLPFHHLFKGSNGLSFLYSSPPSWALLGSEQIMDVRPWGSM